MANYTLLLKERNLMDIPFEILMTAYWRPQDAQLKTLYKSIHEGDTKEYQRLRKIWKTREVWINWCLELLLQNTPSIVLSRIFNNLISMNLDESLRSYYFQNTQSLKKWTGVPDFILKDKHENIIFGEIKIAALKSNHKYSFQQYQKYMQLSALYLMLQKTKKPGNICHFLVLPTDNIADNLSDNSTWKPEVKSGILKPFNDSHESQKLMKQFENSFRDFLSNENIAKMNNIDKDRIDETLSSMLEKVKTHVYSWSSFLDAYEDAIKGKAYDGILSNINRMRELTETN